MNTVAITGHTSGLGEYLIQHLSENYQCTGLSRKNGYHLKRDQDKIVQEVLKHDVFINNAHKDFAQPELFNKVFTEWKTDSTKTIVNINCIRKYDKNNADKSKVASHNQLDKVARAAYLDHANTKCRVITITLGYLTQYTDGRDGPRISYSEVANTLSWVLSMPDNLEVTELALLPRSKR